MHEIEVILEQLERAIRTALTAKAPVRTRRRRVSRRRMRTPVVSGVTSETRYYDPLTMVMYDLGGCALARRATALVGNRCAHAMTTADRALRPHDGKPHWHNRVHLAKYHLKGEGIFRRDSKRGVWELTEKGFRLAERLINTPRLG